MKVKKYLTLILTVFVLLSCSLPFMPSAASAENTEHILFHETFEGDKFTQSVWTGHTQTFSNEEMLVPADSWPTLNLPSSQIDSTKSYELSYRVMFEKEAGDGGWRCYDYGNNVAFGGAKPGNAFGWKTCVPEYSISQNPDDSALSPANINTWYTVKIEFCTDSAKRYMRHTLLGADGTTLFTKKENVIYQGETASTAIPSDTPITFTNLYFWNCGMSGNVHIDDVILKEIQPTVEEEPEKDPNLVFSEDFNSASLSALHGNGWARESEGIGFENGAMSVAPGAYIYLTINNKDDASVYEVTYDIMSKKAGNGKGGLNFYSENAPAFSLGYLNSVSGFNCGKADYADSSRIISGLSAQKWYTVSVKFYEDAKQGFIIYTLADKETGQILGSYTPDYFDAQESTAVVSGNHTYFCLWNRNECDETFLIDNIQMKFIEKPNKVFLDEDFDVPDLSALNSNGNGWRGSSGAVSVSDSTLKLGQNAYIYFDVPGKNNTDAYRVTYDVCVTGETDSKKPTLSLIGGDAYMLGMYNPLTGLLGTPLNFEASADRIIPVSGDANGKWYTVTAEFCESSENGFMRFTLTDRDSGTILGSSLCTCLESFSSMVEITADAKYYYFWNRGSENSVVSIDNVKFEQINSAIYVDAKTGITTVDYLGSGAVLNDNITPAIKQISINFTAQITEESARTGIILKEKNGAPIPFDVSVNKKTAVLTLSSLLKPGTDYQLILSEDIKTANDIALTGETVVDFLTGKPNAMGKIKPFNMSDISEITGGETFNVEASLVNTKAEAAPVTLIAAFYSDKVLTAIQISDTYSIAASSAKDISMTVNAPQDMTGIDSMKVFLWNSGNSMEPCAEYAELTAETAK